MGHFQAFNTFLFITTSDEGSNSQLQATRLFGAFISVNLRVFFGKPPVSQTAGERSKPDQRGVRKDGTEVEEE